MTKKQERRCKEDKGCVEKPGSSISATSASEMGPSIRWSNGMERKWSYENIQGCVL